MSVKFTPYHREYNYLSLSVPKLIVGMTNIQAVHSRVSSGLLTNLAIESVCSSTQARLFIFISIFAYISSQGINNKQNCTLPYHAEEFLL